MFAYLDGRFTFKSPALLHVDVHGVGYEVNITLNTFTAVQALDGGRLYVHLQIKEDAHTLYGFSEVAEKEMFLMLISVSGVGAAIARMMLSSLRADEVSAAITQGNVRLLEGVKGIGKKTAERLVLELKDKMSKSGTSATMPVIHGSNVQNDAFTALMALGIGRTQADQALQKILKQQPDIANLEELIKKALKAI